jgi:hypothetical protein
MSETSKIWFGLVKTFINFSFGQSENGSLKLPFGIVCKKFMVKTVVNVSCHFTSFIYWSQMIVDLKDCL